MTIQLAALDRRGRPLAVASGPNDPDDDVVEQRLEQIIQQELVFEPVYFWGPRHELPALPLALARAFPAWRSHVDQPVDFSGDWVWTRGFELRQENRRHHQFLRKAGTTKHGLDNFTIATPDYRDVMIDGLSHIHSADARADLQIDYIYQTLGHMLEQQEADLLDQKALQPEDDETIPEADRARVKTALNEINKLSVSVKGLRRSHLLPSSRIRIAQALIRGHGTGEIIIQIEHYYLLATRLSERLVADTDTDAKLANMIANLALDEGRNPTDRLVPKDHRGALFSVDVDALYRQIILPPPQFGSGDLT